MAHPSNWLDSLACEGHYVKIVVHWKPENESDYLTEEHPVPGPRQTKPNDKLYTLTELVWRLEEGMSRVSKSLQPTRVQPHCDSRIVDTSPYPATAPGETPHTENVFWFEMWFDNVRAKDDFYDESGRVDFFHGLLFFLPV